MDLYGSIWIYMDLYGSIYLSISGVPKYIEFIESWGMGLMEIEGTDRSELSMARRRDWLINVAKRFGLKDRGW